MNIECLPLELLASIICKLPGRDLGNVAQTCKKFRETTLIDSVWQLKCKKEFSVCGEALEGSTVQSFRVLYTQILYHYGYLLGIWQPQINHYGGLVKIQLVEGGLTACKYLAPVDPKVYLPLGTKKIFEIRMSDEALIKVECLKGQNGGHKLQINKNNDEEFTMKCCKPDKHGSLDRRKGNLQDLRNWTQEELGLDEAELTNHDRDCDLHELDCICTYKRLARPMPSSTMPIRPGLFKGTYGGHGIEIVCLTYEGDRLKGIKVTGDPNVPASKVSMDIHLDEPMLLKASQQESLHTIAQLDKEEVRAPSNLPSSQPFILPDEVHDRGMSALGRQTGLELNRCTHRYFASGLIAMTDFTDPARTPAHFIVFSEDVLGFLWLELHSISVYSRVIEKFWT